MWASIDGHRVLWLQVPSLYGHPCNRLALYMNRSETNWAEPGPINGWDGNEEFPTLAPSIQAKETVDGVEVNGWHGYLISGRLVGV